MNTIRLIALALAILACTCDAEESSVTPQANHLDAFLRRILMSDSPIWSYIKTRDHDNLPVYLINPQFPKTYHSPSPRFLSIASRQEAVEDYPRLWINGMTVKDSIFTLSYSVGGRYIAGGGSGTCTISRDDDIYVANLGVFVDHNARAQQSHALNSLPRHTSCFSPASRDRHEVRHVRS